MYKHHPLLKSLKKSAERKKPNGLIRAIDPYVKTQSTPTRYGVKQRRVVAKTREVFVITQEAKRNTWRAHLEEVTRTKDAKKAWAVVNILNGTVRAQNGKTLVHKGREYVSDKAKASAII